MLETIISIFKNHEISEFPELSIQKFGHTEKHPISEGIIFEGSDFVGEIFFYKNPVKPYLDMNFIAYNSEKSFPEIYEIDNDSNLNKVISQFLTNGLNEMKFK